MKIKNYSNYFFVTFLFCLFGLFIYKNYNNIQYFPNSYTHTDWLIHYYDGYIRRGFFGFLVLKFDEITGIDAKFIIFYMQVIAYTLYLYFIFKFFKNFKFTFFLITFLLFPLFIIYPLYENEALGRKEIFLILSFQIFLTYIDKFKKFQCFIVILFIIFINTLIHEVIIFYSFFFINIFLINYNFQQKEKKIYFISFITFILLIVIFNLTFKNTEALNLMINNLNLKYGLSYGSGALSWLQRDVFEQIILFNGNLSIYDILRFFIVLLFSLFPFYLFFYKNIENFKFSFFKKNLLINLFALFLLLFLVLDWYMFFLIFLFFLYFIKLKMIKNL